MRVQVSGTSESTAVLRSYLHEAGDVVVWKDGDNSEPDYIIHLEERKAQEIYFESLQCDLERDIIRHVRQKAIVPIVLCGAPNNRPKHIIRIVFPPSQSPAVELGVQMGLADYMASKRKAAAELTSPSSQPESLERFEEILWRFVDKIRPADSEGIKLAQQLEALYERLLLERDGAIETLRSELEEATNPPKVPASRPWWKWIWAAIFMAAFVPTAEAQIYPIRPVIQFTSTNPNGNACTYSSAIQYYQGTQYTCANNATYAASGGGGSSSWSALTNPTGNLSLTMAADTSLFTFNAATGAATDLFKWTDTTNNTGTGALLHSTTASGSAATPWQADANGVGAKLNSSGNLVSVSTSTLDWSAGSAVKVPVTSAKLISTNAGGQIAAAAAETAPITVSATGGIACGTCATTTNGGALSGTTPITVSAAGAIGVNISSNLQITGSNLDTIQGIQTTSDPQFASIGLGVAAAGGTANGFLYQSSGVTNTANQIAGGTLSAGNTTITCTSTTGFPSSGIAWIKDGPSSELVTYTGTTGTTLTGATRGAYATTAGSHTTAAYVLPVTAMFARSATATPSMFIAHWGTASGPIVIVGSGGDDNGIPASSVPTLVATPGRLSGDTIQATNLFTTTGTAFYRSGGTVINIGDDKAYTVNINSSTGATAFNGTGAITMNGLVSKYNNISTAGIGLVADYAAVASTGQAASIGATNLQCGGAVCAAGKYRVTVYDVVTATGTGTLTSTIGYNDGTAARTQTSAGVSTTATNFEQVSYVLRADGVNNITYATTLSNTGTYSIYVDLERLQ